MSAIKVLLKDPKGFAIEFLMRTNRLFSDELYLRLMFRLKMGYWLNLKQPRTFAEKIQWLKLFYRRQDLPSIVDKYSAKEFASERIGTKYIIPTLGVWKKPEEIDFEKLPNQFVLKTTDGGGSAGVIICKDKQSLDRNGTVAKLHKAMKQDIFGMLREWPYKHIEKRIIAEEYLDDGSVSGSLNDYKFYCFNGKVTYCEVITGRKTHKTIDFFDLEWNHIEFCFNGLNYSEEPIQMPILFEEMVEVAKKLCHGFPYARVDLYVSRNKVYFGEVTFYPASGFRGFWPSEWNNKIGDMIILPQIITNK